MRSFQTRLAVLAGALALLVGPARALTNTSARPGRQYDGRIRMHATPVPLLAPDNNLETRKGAPESIERDLTIPSDAPQESQIRPNGLRLKAMQEKQQNKSWILPPSTEKKDEETTSNQQKETIPSGWGWLADDVRARQQKENEETDQEKNDSEEKDSEFQPPSVLKKEFGGRGTDGIFLDVAFKPVSASIPTKEKVGALATSTLDNNRKERKSRRDGPTTAESPLGRASAADQPRERKFGADATWGNESLWDKNSKTAGTLPQTEALLSISKTDVGGGAIDRAELGRPKTGRRNFNSAAGFQPPPAVPVRDLGNAPWTVGLSGKTALGGSIPFTPGSSVAPSQPIESLKAPELPKPVTAPWLR